MTPPYSSLETLVHERQRGLRDEAGRQRLVRLARGSAVRPWRRALGDGLVRAGLRLGGQGRDRSEARAQARVVLVRRCA